MIKGIFQKLHLAHGGIDAIYYKISEGTHIMQSHEIPNRPFQRVSIDTCKIICNGKKKSI